MLYYLHVKDLALIDSAEIEFGKNLNILTGETGAGKSILIGSINLALGAKAHKDMIRNGRPYGLVELVFGDFTEFQCRKLAELDVFPEDGQVFIQRRITPSRSVIKINDEIVTLSKLKAVTELLIDLHGQHEHQSLLREGAHLRLLDEFIGRDTSDLRRRLEDAYEKYQKSKRRMEGFSMSESERQRELDFLQFELEEIDAAMLREGEEEELAQKCRRYQNTQQIFGCVNRAKELMNQTELSRAVRELTEALRYDETLKPLADSLYDAEVILEDTGREMDAYLNSIEYDAEDYAQTESRLNQIRTVLMKYGGTVEKVETARNGKQKRLQELYHYEQEKTACEREVAAEREKAVALSKELRRRRQEGAEVLCSRVRKELSEMGFLDVKFEMAFSELQEPGRNGMDEAWFMVCLNPGEQLRALNEVASGGELSRIMLSLKTVLADTDEIPTLIFDEIDTGISGRTAEKVSDKLKKIAASHQVICITHLPQIAAKADVHFGIEKQVIDSRTQTRIHRLSEQEEITELARLLAGGSITEAVLTNARELKKLARGRKK